jgi:hypothetical protein
MTTKHIWVQHLWEGWTIGSLVLSDIEGEFTYASLAAEKRKLGAPR